MHRLTLLHNFNIVKILPQISSSSKLLNSNTPNIIDFPEETVQIPKYKPKDGESLETRKARLIYQARKRGILENDLLLGSFVAKYLPQMTEKQINDFDHLLNNPSNEWDIFYWTSGAKEVPKEYQTEIMELLKDHCTNEAKREGRIRQPPLH